MLYWVCQKCGEGHDVPESAIEESFECPSCGVHTNASNHYREDDPLREVSTSGLGHADFDIDSKLTWTCRKCGDKIEAPETAFDEVVECLGCGCLTKPSDVLPAGSRPYLADHPEPNQPSESVMDEASNDTILFVLAILIPIVGYIAGSVRMANNERNGINIVLTAVAGSALWVIIFVIASIS